MFVNQAEMKKDGWMQGAEAFERELKVNLLKKNALLQLWICSLNNIFQYNTRAQVV